MRSGSSEQASHVSVVKVGNVFIFFDHFLTKFLNKFHPGKQIVLEIFEDETSLISLYYIVGLPESEIMIVN